MKVLFYSARDYEIPYLKSANKTHLQVDFTETPLSMDSVILAKGYDCISIFTADDASGNVLEQLHIEGVRYITIRAAGYDNVDVRTASTLGMHVANVPAYSPYSIAEHTVAMLLALSRKLIIADRQVHKKDFTLTNLVGFDLHLKTAGIIGTGKIGSIVARILHGFGCHLLGHDVHPSEELKQDLNMRYCDLEELCMESDIITIHTPLNEHTRYLLNQQLFNKMKKGVFIVNTTRGAVVKTDDLLAFLDNGTIGAFGMDVYEKEKGIFFHDHTSKELSDPVLKKLLSLPNVLVTPHQAFATREALTNIADTTFYNILEWQERLRPENELTIHPQLISPAGNKT